MYKRTFPVMWSTLTRSTPALILPFFEDRDRQYDKNILENRKTEKVIGWNAVKNMYTRDEMDNVSVELHSVMQTTLIAGFMGGCIGGFLRSREAYIYFIENNAASIFKSTLDAQKKLQNYVTIAFGKGVFHWSWRLALFVGSFSLISTTISVYKGETSILEYTAAGTVTGALYKANLGLPGSLVGAGLGAVLSTIGGIIIVSILKIAGVSMDEIREAFYKIKLARHYQMKSAEDKALKQKDTEGVGVFHETFVEQRGEKKIEEF